MESRSFNQNSTGSFNQNLVGSRNQNAAGSHNQNVVGSHNQNAGGSFNQNAAGSNNQNAAGGTDLAMSAVRMGGGYPAAPASSADTAGSTAATTRRPPIWGPSPGRWTLPTAMAGRRFRRGSDSTRMQWA